MDIVIDTPIEVTLLILVLLTFILLALHRLDIAAAVIVFLAPTYIFRIRDVLPYPTNVLEILIWTLFIVWAINKIKNQKSKIKNTSKSLKILTRKTPFNDYSFPLILIFVGAIISIFAGGLEHFQTSIGQFLVLFVEPLLFVIVVIDAMKLNFRRKFFDYLILAYVVSVAAISFISLAGIFSFSPLHDLFTTFDGRLRGFYLSPNHLAMYVAPAILLVISYWLLVIEQRKKILWVAVCILLFLVLYLTKSYGAWLGLTGGLVLLFVFFTRSSGSISLTRFVPAIFALLLIFFVVTEAAGTKFENLLDERGQFSSRLMVWSAAAEILKDHPLFGMGLGTFQDHYLAYQEKFPPYLEWAAPQPHNLFLAFWLQTGILGLVGFVWFLALFFRNISRTALPIAKIAITSAVIAILVHGLIDTPIWKNDLALVFVVLFGAIRCSNKVLHNR